MTVDVYHRYSTETWNVLHWCSHVSRRLRLRLRGQLPRPCGYQKPLALPSLSSKEMQTPRLSMTASPATSEECSDTVN